MNYRKTNKPDLIEIIDEMSKPSLKEKIQSKLFNWLVAVLATYGLIDLILKMNGV